MVFWVTSYGSLFTFSICFFLLHRARFSSFHKKLQRANNEIIFPLPKVSHGLGFWDGGPTAGMGCAGGKLEIDGGKSGIGMLIFAVIFRFWVG